jgi:hypothetical protein
VRETGAVTRPRRKLKAINQDRPPFDPLSPIDVKVIAKKGGLDCRDDGELYDELDEPRLAYLARYRFREATSTDRQLRVEINNALEHIAALRKNFFLKPSVVVTTAGLFHCEPEHSGAVPHSEYPDRVTMHAIQLQALKYLESWVKLFSNKFERQAAARPNNFALPRAENPGLVELVFGLAELWKRRSGHTALPRGQESAWILFLQQSIKTIAQRDIGYDAARKLTDRAIKYPTTPSTKSLEFKRKIEPIC